MDQLLLAQTFDPTASLSTFQAFAVALASFALICLSVFLLFGAARKGNSGAVARVLGAVVLALVPLVIGLGIGASAFGEGFWGWTQLIPGVS